MYYIANIGDQSCLWNHTLIRYAEFDGRSPRNSNVYKNKGRTACQNKLEIISQNKEKISYFFHRELIFFYLKKSFNIANFNQINI